MKLKKYLAKGLALGMLISNLPLYSFANDIENQYYNQLSNIETKEDLKKLVSEGETDTWIEGLANMPTSRADLTSEVVDGKIYCLGGALSISVYTNKVEVYDPKTDTWETKTDMPSNKASMASVVIDKKIYCIGGSSSLGAYSSTVYAYDTITDTWEAKADMPTKRNVLSAELVNGKIYCMGGSNGSYLKTVEVYDPISNTWETKADMCSERGYLTSEEINGKIYCIGGRYNGYDAYSNGIMVYDTASDIWEHKTPMPTKRYALTSNIINGKIYCIGGIGSTYLNTVEVYIAESTEQNAKTTVSKAELSKELVDIEEARKLVNQLEEGELKTQLQVRLDAIVPNISLTPLNSASSVDTYIKTENILSMTLDTNTITFEDFSGIEDMDKINAINVTVSSSLPYQLNAYLPVEIQNSDKTKTMDKTILNIKENSELEYKSFTDLNTKVILKDNCVAGDDIHHGIDLKLKQGIAHEKDVYKATIKLEVEQK